MGLSFHKWGLSKEDEKSNFRQYGQMRSRDGKSQREEKSRREKIREEKESEKNTVFFQWFVAPEGRKVGSLKRRVRSHLARWEMKKCTLLWREAHLQVKKLKTRHVRATFGSWDVEKVHAVLARSTFASEKAKNTSRSDHFWKLRCRKSVTTSKTKQFCETSSFFKLDNIKNEAILRDFVQKRKVECRADGLVPMCLAIFPVHLSKL